MQTHPSFAIGVDVGATKIASALVSVDGQIHASRWAPTQVCQGGAAVLDEIAAQINSLAGEAGGSVAGVGIGTPGQVNSKTGIVANAINLGWASIPLKDEISQRMTHPLPMVIQKDANASALGEYYFGAVRGCEDFLFVSIGSGLGAGVITAGRLVTGASWSAADLGHWSLDPNGQLCSCGQHGCAETVISGPGLIAVTRKALKTGRYPSSLIAEESLTTAQILAAATDGDPLARAAFAQVGYHLGMVLAPCIALLNPANVVIGGGLGLASFAFTIGAAWEALEQRVLPENRQELQIKASTQMSSAVGAASLVWYYQPA